jgi:hypothetical protein
MSARHARDQDAQTLHVGSRLHALMLRHAHSCVHALSAVSFLQHKVVMLCAAAENADSTFCSIMQANVVLLGTCALLTPSSIENDH